MKRLLLIPFALTLALAVNGAEVPEEKELKAMTEKSLVSFGRAVKQKDFTEFYANISNLWRKQTTAEKLLTAFADFLDKDIDIPSAIKKLAPVFNHPAAIDSNDVLVIKGYYPTIPNRVIFQLKYLEEEGNWNLVGIHVNVTE